MRNRPPTRSECAYLWNNFISVGHARHGWNVAPRVVQKSNENMEEVQFASWFRFPFRPTSGSSRRLQSTSRFPAYAEKGTRPQLARDESNFSFLLIMDNYPLLCSLFYIVNSVVLYSVNMDVYLFFCDCLMWKSIIIFRWTQ